MTSNRKAALDGLAFEARRNFRKSTEHWLASAAAVAEARDLCDHGEWGPWLAKTAIPERTARRMVTIARAGLQIGHVAAFGGVARTAELLAEVPEDMLEDHGAADAITVYTMAKTVAGLILNRHAEGDQETADAMLAAMPQTVADADAWRSWAEEIVAAYEAGDRDGISASFDRRPWREEAA